MWHPRGPTRSFTVLAPTRRFVRARATSIGFRCSRNAVRKLTQHSSDLVPINLARRRSWPSQGNQLHQAVQSQTSRGIAGDRWSAHQPPQLVARPLMTWPDVKTGPIDVKISVGGEGPDEARLASVRAISNAGSIGVLPHNRMFSPRSSDAEPERRFQALHLVR